jgi:hypothetical protein
MTTRHDGQPRLPGGLKTGVPLPGWRSSFSTLARDPDVARDVVGLAGRPLRKKSFEITIVPQSVRQRLKLVRCPILDLHISNTFSTSSP